MLGMMRELAISDREQFRIIYHQTTSYSNPIIEKVLYKDGQGRIYVFGDLLDANYLIVHRSGFAHANFDFPEGIGNEPAFGDIDAFIRDNSDIPDYLMFYHAPVQLQAYWKAQNKRSFQVRRRRRYELDHNQFMLVKPSSYSVPDQHRLVPLEECPYADLEAFDLSLDSKFYDSREQFREESFGFVLYNQHTRPVSIAYLLCLVGRNGECDLKTLPPFRNRGYGYIAITNYVRESFLRKINPGWDCFIDNHTNIWVRKYGYSRIIRDYDFVTFAKG